MIEAIARLPSHRMVPRLGAIVGRIACAVDGRHRRIAFDNLTQAYGDAMTPAARRALVRRCYAHFGRVALEILRFGRLSAGTIGSVATHEGLEHLLAARDKGRGVLVCAAHFGNWEMGALLQGWSGVPMALVTRPLDNPALEARLARLRGRSGNTLIDKRLSLTHLIRSLRRGDVIAILVDQRPRRFGVFVPFFGRPALTSLGPALTALRTGAALVPAFCVPKPDGTYRLIYEPEIGFTRTGDIDADVERLTTACTAAVERWVRQYPEAWLWMHDRWRRPK